MQGAAYPAQKVERFAWVFGQRIGPRHLDSRRRVGGDTQKMVLLALVLHDMPGGRGIFPSIDRLADMTGPKLPGSDART